eukprot:jgi/Bigna1/32917/e_gw1.1.46.1
MWNRIHSDVKTMPNSMDGYKYFVIFVHEGTRWVTLELMRKKSEVTQKTIQFLKHIRKLPGCGSIDEFRSDGGGEYMSAKLHSWLTSEGIKWVPSTARTPEQNGMSERHIQTIMAKTRAMLEHARLPVGYWSYAAQTAAYLHNVTSHRSTPGRKTPKELLHHEQPNLKNLTTWGCIGVNHIDKELRPAGGMGARGEYVRMLGYDDRFVRVTKWYHTVFKFPSLKRNKVSDSALAYLYPEGPADADAPEPSSATDELPEDGGPETKAKSKPRRSNRENRGVPGIRYGILGSYYDRLMNIKAPSVQEIEDLPKTYDDAITGDDKKHWIPSTEEELHQLRKLGTFTLVVRPKDTNLVTSKWVFKKKINVDYTIRYKSRLVARGFTQIPGEDFFFSYSPTLSLNSFRIMLAIASILKLKLHGIDILTAFLTGKMDCKVHMEIPKGWKPKTPEEIRLYNSGLPLALLVNKSIYGLTQASAIFSLTLLEHLNAIGFVQLYSDPCLMIMHRQGRIIILSCFVDDICIAYQDKRDLDFVMKRIGDKFEFRDEGELKKTLGIRVGSDNEGNYWISQEDYLTRLAQKYDITPTKRAKTPMITGSKLDEYEEHDKVD